MDPRNKSEDDCYKKNESVDDKRECVFNNDFTLRSLFRGGSFLLSSLRGDNRGQAIFKLEKGANRDDNKRSIILMQFFFSVILVLDTSIHGSSEQVRG